MPLTIPAAISTLIAAKDYEFHASLDITLGNGNLVHIATANIENVNTVDFGPVDYVDDLRESGQVTEALTLAVNRMDLRAQNVDGVLGRMVRRSKALNGAQGIFSIIFLDDDDTPTQLPLLYGEVSNANDKDPDVTFQLVSYLTTDGPIGGFRTLQNACFNRYKDIRCGSLSPLSQGCDHTSFGPNGCDKHLAAAGVTTPAASNNLARNTGFLYYIKPLPGTPPAGPTGIVDGGDDFTSYFKARQSLGGYEGRWAIPHNVVVY